VTLCHPTASRQPQATDVTRVENGIEATANGTNEPAPRASFSVFSPQPTLVQQLATGSASVAN
jgi:hypothetical protein